MLRAAQATCDFYLEHTPTDGIPYWDTGRPGLSQLGDYLARPADPFNEHEPVDSSAAAIACQGLLRLGRRLNGGRGQAAGRALLAGRADDAANAARGAVSGRRSRPRRLAAAHDLPPPARLGLHPARRRHPARRGVHVGRLPSAGGGTLCRAASPARRPYYAFFLPRATM